MLIFEGDLKVQAISQRRTGLRRMFSPGCNHSNWRLIEDFTFIFKFSNGLEEPIDVVSPFEFDGASVPWGLSLFFPRTHADYMQAAAVHDWLYRHGDNRRFADDVFYQALEDLEIPFLWRWIMYAGVRLGGSYGWRKNRRS